MHLFRFEFVNSGDLALDRMGSLRRRPNYDPAFVPDHSEAARFQRRYCDTLIYEIARDDNLTTIKQFFGVAKGNF